MVFRGAAFLATFVLSLILLNAPAKAAKLPIPCTGETLVKVLDIPQSQTVIGRRIDLGYKFTGCSGGEWVGYTGSSSSYLPLKPEMLTALLALAGLDAPPPVPNRLSSGGYGWFWPVALLVGFLVLLKNVIFGRKEATADGVVAAEQSSPVVGEAQPDGRAAQRYKGADAAIERALAARQAGLAPQPAPSAQRARSQPMAAAQSAAPSAGHIARATTMSAAMGPQSQPAPAFGRRVAR
ncbi:MAG: hypothetical protein RL291_1699 [Pseudomonadota bacterium]